MRWTAVLAGLALVACLAPPALAAGEPVAVSYLPPVAAPVIDPFRPPDHPYGSGNRGIDFGTGAGVDVHAAAGGTVTFAGQVGGSLHVVVLHPDGVRTSYSFLAEVSVGRGQEVAQGEVVGVTAGPLHLGARVGDTYIDPSLLLAGSGRAHLVPLGSTAPGPVSQARERGWLREGLRGVAALPGRSVDATRAVVGGGAAALGWARRSLAPGHAAAAGAVRASAAGVHGQLLAELSGALDQLRVAMHYAHRFGTADGMWSEVHRAAGAWTYTGDCTPAEEIPPSAPGERRIAVLVAGFGSQGGDAAILDLDTDSLGYDGADRVQFSYRGGRVPGVGSLEGVPAEDYGPADSQVDIRESGARLRALLEDIRAAHPGVPVDLFAHSQGGLVVRAALGDEGDGHDPRLPELGHVITLGSPHDGADLATAGAGIRGSAAGSTALDLVGSLGGGEVDPNSVAARQLAETSGFMRGLARRPLPPATRVTSIAASGDLVVPGTRSILSGAVNVVVAGAGLHAHSELPGSAAAHREIALALAGRPPTCRNRWAALRTAVTGGAISLAEDGLGALGTAASLRLQRAVFPTVPVSLPGRSR